MQTFNHSFSQRQERKLKPIIQLPKIDLHESTLDVSLLDVMAIEDFLSLLKSKTESNWKDLWKETCIFSKQLKAARELLSIGSSLISNKSTRKILDRLVDVTHILLNADRVTILELDSTGREMIVTHSRDDKLIGLRIPASAGIEGEVLERRSCANAADLFQDPRFIPALDSKLGLKARNAACAPVVAGGAVVGVILAVNKLATGKGRDPSNTGFSANEVLLLGFIAANIGLALKQTTLYRSLSSHALSSTLDLHKSMDYNLSLKLMKLENDKSLQGLIEFAYNKLDAERVSIFTYSASSKSLVCAVSQDIKGFSIPHDKGFAGLSFTAMRLINIANTQTDERHNKDIDNHIGFVTRNLLCAPIVSQEGIALGVIQAVNKKSGACFTYVDEEQINEVCRMMVALLKEKADLAEKNNITAEDVLSPKLPSITFARCVANMVLATSLGELVVETENAVLAHTEFNLVRLYVADGDRLFRIPPAKTMSRAKTASNDSYEDTNTVEQLKLTELNVQLKQALQFSTMVEYKYTPNEFNSIVPGLKLQHGFIMPVHAKAYPYQPGSCVLIVGNTKQDVQVTEYTREIMETIIEYFAHSISSISEKYAHEETMKQMRNQFHLLNNSLGALEDYVIILNGEGKFVGCNKCVEDIFGMRPTDPDSYERLSPSTKSSSNNLNNQNNNHTEKYIQHVHEGMHYAEWLTDMNSPELVRDIGNALRYRESKSLESARLTSPIYPDGISVDYQVTAVCNPDPTFRDRSPSPFLPNDQQPPRVVTFDSKIAESKYPNESKYADSKYPEAKYPSSNHTSTSNSVYDSPVQDIEQTNQLMIVVVIHVNTRRSVLGAAFESAVKGAPRNGAKSRDTVIDLTSVTNGVDAAEQIVSAIRNSFVLDEDVEQRLKETMETLAFTKRRMSMKQADPTALALAVQSADCLLVDPSLPMPKEMFEWEFNVLLIKDPFMLCNLMGTYFDTLCNVSELGVDQSTLARYIAEVGRHYHDRPFHNLQHATCVTHFTFMLIRASEAPQNLKNHQVFAIMISAVAHDVDHPGNTNTFEINSGSDLAIRYNDQSVLENHHCSTAFRIMRKPHLQILAKLQKSLITDIRKTIIGCIMATDMSVHFELIDETKKRAVDGWNFEEVKDQALLGKILLHAADLSNPVRPFHMTKTWAERISVEFNDQVKREQALGMPVLGFMSTPDEKALCKNETGFASFVVAPMWRAIVSVYPQLHFLVEQLEKNLTLWKGLYEKLTNEENANAKDDDSS